MRSLPLRTYQSLKRFAPALLLTLLLAACSLPGSGSTTNNSTPTSGTTSGSTPTKTTGNSSPTATQGTPTIQLGIQPCPDAVKSTTYWDPIVGTQKGVSKVESVTCATLIGLPALQALVNVRYDGTGGILDVYVYNKLTNPSPQQLFKLQGLYKGASKISNYNTIMTGEVDANSSINKDQPNAALQQQTQTHPTQSDGAGTLVPVAFPGIFPDLTRFQAETDQVQVNQGQTPWKLDAQQTASTMAVTLLKWSTGAQTTLKSGGGANDTDAVVDVKSANPGAGTITVTLSRLEGNTNGGIWEVLNVQAGDGASISAPASRDRLISPAAVSGKGNAFEGKIGKVSVLDHLYNDIGHADANGGGNGPSSFNASITYVSSFKGGVQEGIVVLYVANNPPDIPCCHG